MRARPWPRLIFALQQNDQGRNREFAAKISLAILRFRITLSVGRSSSGLTRRAIMAWKTPKIIEVPVGMEINMYACAARK